MVKSRSISRKSIRLRSQDTADNLKVHELAVVYCRVSTSLQDNESQIQMGRQRARELGYTDDKIIVVEDHGVSARKKSLTERNGLMRVLDMVEAGLVGHVIIRDRDRLARKMIEYLIVLQRVKHAGVELVLSDSGAVPVSDNFGVEAMNAHMAEIEGDKIAQRTKSASRFYPPAPMGYKKLGRKGSTRYEFTDKITLVEDLFAEFKAVTTKARYQEFRRSWKARTGRYPDGTLQRLFYAAAIDVDGQIHRVHHIPPITDVQTVQDNRRKLDDWGYGLRRDTPIIGLKKVFVPVICASCGTDMDCLIRRGHRVFKCTKCSQIKRSEDDVYEAITTSIADVLAQLNSEVIQYRTVKLIRSKRNSLLRQLDYDFAQRFRTNRHILDALQVGALEAALEKRTAIEISIDNNLQTKFKLDVLLTHIQDLVHLVEQSLAVQAVKPSESLQKLLIHHIAVDIYSLDVYIGFADLTHMEVAQ